MTMMLNSCPFCSHNTLHITHQEGRFQVECMECLATGPSHSLFDTAIAEWNHLAISVQRLSGERLSAPGL